MSSSFFFQAMSDAAHPACILETRKTAPGLRLVDKWAVVLISLSCAVTSLLFFLLPFVLLLLTVLSTYRK